MVVYRRQLAILEKILAHFLFWFLVLFLSSPFWLPESCKSSLFKNDKSVKRIAIGDVLIIGEKVE